MRRLIALLMVTVVAGLIWVGIRIPMRSSPVTQPRLAGSLSTAVGGVAGEDPAKLQRLSFEADLSNTGSAPVRGWKWRVVVAPELAPRVQSVSQPSEGP